MKNGSNQTMRENELLLDGEDNQQQKQSDHTITEERNIQLFNPKDVESEFMLPDEKAQVRCLLSSRFS